MSVVNTSNQINYTGNNPLDAKLAPVASVADLENIALKTRYVGMTVYVKNEGKEYWYINSAWVPKIKDSSLQLTSAGTLSLMISDSAVSTVNFEDFVDAKCAEWQSDNYIVSGSVITSGSNYYLQLIYNSDSEIDPITVDITSLHDVFNVSGYTTESEVRTIVGEELANVDFSYNDLIDRPTEKVVSEIKSYEHINGQDCYLSGWTRDSEFFHSNASDYASEEMLLINSGASFYGKKYVQPRKMFGIIVDMSGLEAVNALNNGYNINITVRARNNEALKGIRLYGWSAYGNHYYRTVAPGYAPEEYITAYENCTGTSYTAAPIEISGPIYGTLSNQLFRFLAELPYEGEYGVTVSFVGDETYTYEFSVFALESDFVGKHIEDKDIHLTRSEVEDIVEEMQSSASTAIYISGDDLES